MPVFGGASGARQHFEGLITECNRSFLPEMHSNPHFLYRRRRGHALRLVRRAKSVIPSAREMKKLVEFVTNRLQTVIIACQQARQGGGDEVPFGVQHAEAFVVSFSTVLQGEGVGTVGEGVACLGHGVGTAGADEFRCQRG